ncbi:hypothetical protein [Streptomyces actinomycinicus]|uniref:hypothetical protein n=1 Tax=Streptomyces actinomycinicus TaxID=1695166 RepID=UPI001F4676F4|nr:hypothetical protein [Streptomyces actinomycinicus]
MTWVQNRRTPGREGQLDDCLHACAVHSGKLVGSLDRRRTELAEQLRKLLVVFSTTGATVPAPAPAGCAPVCWRRSARNARPSRPTSATWS